MQAPRRFLTCLILTAAFCSGLLYLLYVAHHPVFAFSEEERIGLHLAQGEGFSSPFAAGAVAPPTSWCPPVYPALIGLTYRILGVRSSASVLTIFFFNLLCRAACAVALLRLGEQFFGLAAGALAAIIFLLDPIYRQAAILPWDNSLALALFLWLLIAATHLGKRPRSPLPLAALGVATGLLALTNAAYVLTIPLLLIIAAAKSNRRACLAPAAALLLTLLPWTARNYARFHQLFFVRANVYTELWLGNQPGHTGWVAGDDLRAHPSQDPHNRRQLLILGEFDYFKICKQRFLAEFHAAPAEFFRRCANRLAYLFIGEPSRPNALFHVLFGGLGLAGAWLAMRIRREAGLIMLAAFLAIAPYLPTQVYDRYVLPLRAILALLAAFLWCTLSRRLALACNKTLPSPRVAAQA